MNQGGAEREGDTEFEAGSRLWAASTEPNAELKLTNHEIMIWAEIKSWTLNWLGRPGALCFFLKCFYVIGVEIIHLFVAVSLNGFNGKLERNWPISVDFLYDYSLEPKADFWPDLSSALRTVEQSVQEQGKSLKIFFSCLFIFLFLY